MFYSVRPIYILYDLPREVPSCKALASALLATLLVTQSKAASGDKIYAATLDQSEKPVWMHKLFKDVLLGCFEF